MSKSLNTTEYVLARTQNWENRKYMAVVALWLALKCIYICITVVDETMKFLPFDSSHFGLHFPVVLYSGTQFILIILTLNAIEHLNPWYNIFLLLFGLRPSSNFLMKQDVSEACSHSIVRHLNWWTPYIELFSVTGHNRFSK